MGRTASQYNGSIIRKETNKLTKLIKHYKSTRIEYLDFLMKGDDKANLIWNELLSIKKKYRAIEINIKAALYSIKSIFDEEKEINSDNDENIEDFNDWSDKE